jgi:hypothetical protein
MAIGSSIAGPGTNSASTFLLPSYSTISSSPSLRKYPSETPVPDLWLRRPRGSYPYAADTVGAGHAPITAGSQAVSRRFSAS